MRLIVVCALSSTMAVPAWAASDQIIILGGGKDAAAAASWVERWQEVAPTLDGLLVLPPGYPKVVESKSIAGLNPGFHIAVLGFCDEAAVRERFELFMLHAGMYTKQVQVPVEGACPTLQQGVIILGSGSIATKKQGHLEAVLTVSPTALTLLLFTFDARERVKGKERIVLDGDTGDGREQNCSAELADKPGAVVVEVSCTLDSPGCGDRVTAYTKRITITRGSDPKPIALREEILEEKREGYCD